MRDDHAILPADEPVVHIDRKIHSGAPVFIGTRVPVRTLLEYIEGGYRLDEYLDHFPSVRREQAISFLRRAARALIEKNT